MPLECKLKNGYDGKFEVYFTPIQKHTGLIQKHSEELSESQQSVGTAWRGRMFPDVAKVGLAG